MLKKCLYVTVAVMSIALAGCKTGLMTHQSKTDCAHGLENAYDDLNAAKDAGYQSSVSWSKAATMISSAKVKQSHQDFSGCVDDVKQANYLIEQSKKGQ